MTRPGSRRLVIAAIAGAALWLLAMFWLGPELIRLGHAGRGGPILDRVLSGRSTIPLDAYLDRWYRLAAATTALLAGATLLVFLDRRFSNQRRALLQWLVGGERVIDTPALLWYGTTLGVLGGAAEAVYRVIRHLVTQRPAAEFYWEVLWMAPLAAGVAALLVAAGLAVLAHLGRTRVSLPKATIVFAYAAFHGVLGSEGFGLYPIAVAIASLGLAIVVARFVSARADGVLRVHRKARPYLLGGAGAAVAAAILYLPPVAERRALLGRSPAEGDPPNILLIILDTVRAANLSLYGYQRPTTPHLEDWARAGVTFERAFATAPWTLPTHATLFTGRYAYETRTGVFNPLDDTFPTLAEALGGRGYATAGFVANLIYTTQASGLHRGFDRYQARRITLAQIVASSWLSELLARPLRARMARLRIEPKNGARVTDEFLRWLDGREDRPFFAFLNYFDAHEPYLLPDDYALRFGPRPTGSWDDFKAGWRGDGDPAHAAELALWLNQYDGAIAYLDDQLGRIRDELAERGLLENTLVIVTSDHGEMFGEHGQISHPHSLYLPLLHVPLIVSFPGRTPSGLRVLAEASLRDLPATVLDLAGMPNESGIPGTSLSGLWAGAARAGSPLLAELEPLVFIPPWGLVSRGDGRMKTWLDRGWHYIRNGDGTEELYDTAADPEELRNLVAGGAPDSLLARFRAAVDSIPR